MRRRVIWAVMATVIVATVGCAFFFSLQPPEVSSAQSGWVETLLDRVAQTLCHRDWPQSLLSVRKLAHFTEYSLLGAELCLLVCLLGVTLQRLANALAFGLLTAVTDESLQILSGRGAMVKDILLDYSGVLFGALMVLAIWGVFRLLREKRKDETHEKA